MFEHRLCRIDRQIPAIKGIDDVVIAKRIKYETKQDGFCKGTTLLKRNEPASINQSVEKVSAKHRKAQPLVSGKKTPTKLVKDSEKDARIDGSQDEDSNNDKEVQREVRVRKTPVKDASIAQSMEIVSHKNKQVQAEVGVKNTPFKLVTKVEKAAELLIAALENYNHAFKEAARQSNFKDRINKTNKEVWKCIDSYKEKRNQKHERQQSSKDPSLEEVNNIQEPVLDANTVTKDQPSHTELHQPSLVKSIVDIINPPSPMEQCQPVVELSLDVFKTPTTNATESHTQAYESHYGLHTRGPKGQDNPRNNPELPNPLLNLAEIMDLPTQVIEEAARLCDEQSAKVLVSKHIAFPEPVRRSNREIQPGLQLKSPFMGRVVQLTVPAPKVYMNFCEWVYEGNCNDSDILFEYGVDCGERRDFCSLHPDKYITTPIIDLWAILLNENEKYRSKNSLLRFFVTTKIAIGSAGKGGTKQSRAAQFKVLFEDELKKIPLVNVQEVSLFMFPICYRERYYLLCFDMVEFKIDLIDNMKEGTQDIYGHTIRIMTDNFLAYLKQVKHKKSYMFADVKPKRIDLSWQTEFFFTDCGIFTMRHTETYKGGATTNWKCGLVNESEEQTEQLMALRDTYLNVILRSHLNARREKVLQRAREWLKIKDDLEYNLDNEALS